MPPIKHAVLWSQVLFSSLTVCIEEHFHVSFCLYKIRFFPLCFNEGSIPCNFGSNLLISATSITESVTPVFLIFGTSFGRFFKIPIEFMENVFGITAWVTASSTDSWQMSHETSEALTIACLLCPKYQKLETFGI